MEYDTAECIILCIIWKWQYSIFHVSYRLCDTDHCYFWCFLVVSSDAVCGSWWCLLDHEVPFQLTGCSRFCKHASVCSSPGSCHGHGQLQFCCEQVGPCRRYLECCFTFLGGYSHWCLSYLLATWNSEISDAVMQVFKYICFWLCCWFWNLIIEWIVMMPRDNCLFMHAHQCSQEILFEVPQIIWKFCAIMDVWSSWD